VMEPPPPPTRWRPDLDPGLEAVCLKALAKAPADRYASMREFAAALQPYVLEKARTAAPKDTVSQIFEDIAAQEADSGTRPGRPRAPARLPRTLGLWVAAG